MFDTIINATDNWMRHMTLAPLSSVVDHNDIVWWNIFFDTFSFC